MPDKRTPKEIAEQLINDATASDSTLKCAENPGPNKIFAHKHLDPQCIENGCQSLLIDQLRAQLAEAQKIARSFVTWLFGYPGTQEELEQIENADPAKCFSECFKIAQEQGNSIVAKDAERNKLAEALRKIMRQVMEVHDHCVCDEDPPIMDSRNRCLYCCANETARAALAELKGEKA